ncbi:MAG: CheR family methyltransferase [Phaeospirillum sp.]|nr:CheR family methyltransferase [Phaeospirillum sp.]
MAGETVTRRPPSPHTATADSAGSVAPRSHIVGIGASAGGLEAFEQFFHACPTDSGMAFVLVPHLDPGHESLLTEILQRSTAMPVVQAEDQMAVAPDRVYIIPPNREMAILGGVLQLSMPEMVRGQRMPIDAFLRSLAEDQAENAIGIILSGTATDGTLGLRAILGAGGICMVQDPATAKYDGMPRSAIGAGYATHVLPADKMPAALIEITQHWTFRLAMPAIFPERTDTGMNQILLHVRSATGHDFSLYKRSTITRRIIRRMEQHSIDDMAVYARFLKENPAEVQMLFKEMLINVTSFFRDPEAFAVLKQTILPKILAANPPDSVLRVWVAGCATGEEAYSIAMVLHELLNEIREQRNPGFGVQIYATDLDEDAITVARTGVYPPNIAQDVSPERLQRFFVKEDSGYKIRKEIREMVIFAVQNVIKDPPFTKLDLLSCRNLMIYLEPELQERLIPNFHYALKPNGVLFLSTSESISKHPDLFSQLDRKWKFFRANHAPTTKMATELAWTADTPGRTIHMPPNAKPKISNIADLSNRALLNAFAPAAVTTDSNGNILFVHGDTGKYLRPPPGPVTTNVVEMAREGLQLDLRAALLAASVGNLAAQSRDVLVKTDTGFTKVALKVKPLPSQRSGSTPDETLLLVTFQDITKAAEKRKHAKHPPAWVEPRRVEQLERELAYAKENLQTTIEEQQASNEELKSANEELQSTNEELQSSNEELETSKEELQSLNEEVLTVNSELTTKIEQLSNVQNDLKNLFDNINIGTVILDHQLVIRRYTRDAVKIYRLIATDVGRPLGDIQSNMEGVDLLPDLKAVLDTLIPCERQVHTTDGAWYLARIQPYRTLDNVIEGVVLSFADVTELKLAIEDAKRSEAMLATAHEIASLGGWEMDVASGVMRWSDGMFKIFGAPPDGSPISLQTILATLDQDDQTRMTAAIQTAIEGQTTCDILCRITRRDGAIRYVRSRARTSADAEGRVTSLTGTTQDITELLQGDAALRDSKVRAEQGREGHIRGVWDWTIPEGKLRLSAEWGAMLGYAGHEIGNHRDEWLDRIHPDDRARTTQAVERYLNGETPRYESCHRLRGKDGRYIQVLCHGEIIERTADGAPLRMIGITTDITGQKQADEQLRLLNATLGQE